MEWQKSFFEELDVKNGVMQEIGRASGQFDGEKEETEEELDITTTVVWN